MHEVQLAGVLGSIFKTLTGNGLEAIGGLLLLVLGFLVKKYLVPLLQTQIAKQTAEHVLIIADDVTDYFVQKYPGGSWSIWLDRAIDKIIEVTGVGREAATRAAQAAIQRKVVAGFQINGKNK